MIGHCGVPRYSETPDLIKSRPSGAASTGALGAFVDRSGQKPDFVGADGEVGRF